MNAKEILVYVLIILGIIALLIWIVGGRGLSCRGSVSRAGTALVHWN